MTSTPTPGRRWLAAAGDLLLGARCHGCDAAWWGVCPDCRAELAERRPWATRPDPCPEGFPRTVASSAYDDLVRGLVNAHKERQALGLTPLLGERLAASVAALLTLTGTGTDPGRPLALVPVPSAARAVRERGFDATTAMARAAARRLGTPVVVADLLVQESGVRDQSGLDARARQANLAGGFRLRRRPLLDTPVILVDDLVTTGASLTEAARVLRRGGAEVVGAATVAATLRRRVEGPLRRGFEGVAPRSGR